MESKIKYSLVIELRTRGKDKKLESYLFNRIFNIKLLGSGGHQIDPNSDTQSRLLSSFIYEIETVNNAFLGQGKLEKSLDFIRRVNYMYDWTQLKINLRGTPLSIQNSDELISQWRRLKTSLLKDYKGFEVDRYIEKKDKQMEEGDFFLHPFFQYFTFGLIFPQVPHTNHKTWVGERLVQFSEYENEKFKEEIVLNSVENEIRKYTLSLKTQEDSQIELEQYEGEILMPENDIYPSRAIVEVVLRLNGIATQWYFKLDRV